MREYHYWLVAVDAANNNKPYLIYACPERQGENMARTRGLEILGDLDFRIKRFPTREISAASSFLRGKRVAQTHSLSEAGRRIGHSKSLRQRARRQGSSGFTW